MWHEAHNYRVRIYDFLSSYEKRTLFHRVFILFTSSPFFLHSADILLRWCCYLQFFIACSVPLGVKVGYSFMLYSLFFADKRHGLLALTIFSFLLFLGILLNPKPDLLSQDHELLGQVFTVLSESAGNPYFLITTSLLCVLPLVMKYKPASWCVLVVPFAVLLGLSFATKTGLKQVSEVARPYVYQLQDLGVVDSTEAFYRLSTQEKASAVQQVSDKVSKWRLGHWFGETNYSLPSGHTLFAALCVAFWGGFLLREKHYVLAAVLIAWGCGVGWSRIWLGMHWHNDLLVSVLCAFGLYLLVPMTMTLVKSSTLSNNEPEKVLEGK